MDWIFLMKINIDLVVNDLCVNLRGFYSYTDNPKLMKRYVEAEPFFRIANIAHAK
jgi:hypothetical protein